MKIKLSSVLVDDQDKALKFYTEVLGFERHADIPMPGTHYRWVTVIAPGAPDVELVLEPDANPASQAFKKALFEQGIPLNAFEVDDVQKEYERLKGLGVRFIKEPTDLGPVSLAGFDDTCGNIIQIYKASV